MPKYTDEQIQQALECCRYKSKSNCDCCHYREVAYCRNVLHREAIDLINRQEEQIERLKRKIFDVCMRNGDIRKEIDRLQYEADRYKRYYFNHDYDKLIAEAKSEAIKEFAEMLKDNTVPAQVGNHQYNVITKEGINYYTSRALIKVGESDA